MGIFVWLYRALPNLDNRDSLYKPEESSYCQLNSLLLRMGIFIDVVFGMHLGLETPVLHPRN
jgi:hypothetical protein